MIGISFNLIAYRVSKESRRDQHDGRFTHTRPMSTIQFTTVQFTGRSMSTHASTLDEVTTDPDWIDTTLDAINLKTFYSDSVISEDNRESKITV